MACVENAFWEGVCIHRVTIKNRRRVERAGE
jgi:hypothetical protein